MQSYIKKANKKLLVFAMACLTLFACDSAIYDYEGDCSVNYKVRFRYDYNMKYADAFAHEVNHVTLYLIDNNGNIAWKGSESGDTLATPGYAMTVNVKPGKYSLLAWCGTKDKGSFVVPETNEGSELTCTLNREHDEDGSAFVDKDLDRLFYGYLGNQDFIATEGTYYYEVPLIKNTNNFRVVLQHLSGMPVDKDEFTFIIEDDNGSMDWDNSLLPDEKITYYAWHRTDGVAGMTEPDGTYYEFKTAVAEFTLPRLVKERSAAVRSGEEVGPRLTIFRNHDGTKVLSVPLIQYALMVKGNYNQNMDDQEFLDRQDEWNMVFFIDEGYRWVEAFIYINSWKVVIQNVEEL